MPRRGGASPKQQGSRNGGADRAAVPRRSHDSDPGAGRIGPPSRVAAARDKLVRGVLSPFNAILITRRNLEEVLEDAVRRGRMTRADAQDMVQMLLARGARVTDDLLADVQRILESSAAHEAEAELNATGDAGRLPISGYDELSAAQVQDRLEGLSHVQLRRLRDYEQRNANRKTVLERLGRKLR